MLPRADRKSNNERVSTSLDDRSSASNASGKNFNRIFQKPFLHQATFNRRLKTTGGRYHLASHHLDFNPTVF